MSFDEKQEVHLLQLHSQLMPHKRAIYSWMSQITQVCCRLNSIKYQGNQEIYLALFLNLKAQLLNRLPFEIHCEDNTVL
jgi:hypothetical protein